MKSSSKLKEIELNISKFKLFLFIVVILLSNFLASVNLPEFLQIPGKITMYLLLIFLMIKILLIDKRVENTERFYLSKLIDLILISFISALFGFNINILGLTIIILIATTYIFKGADHLYVVQVISIVSYIEMIALNFEHFSLNIDTLFSYAFYVLYFILILALSNYLLKKGVKQEDIVIDYESKIEKLNENNLDLMNLNTELKCKIANLEQKVKKDSLSIAELSSIQEVGQVVNSTLDVKELLNIIVDVIIGLMGAAYCTIFLKVDNSKKIEVKSSNIEKESYIEDLREKVALKMFDLVEENCKSVANNIDPYTYPNGLDRGVESALFVPIVNKNKVLGLILCENSMPNWADERTKRFVETIANQVGLAIENAILYEEMERLASTDALTSINNRMNFQHVFAEEFEKAKGKYPISLIMMDIDHFKKINDTYGHDFGDEVLKNTAKVVKERLGKNETIFRFGGEEFIILCKNTSIEAAFSIANNLRMIIEGNVIMCNDKEVKITVSMGVSEHPSSSANEKELLKASDEALYKAKEDGRNCVRKAPPRIKSQKDNFNPDNFEITE